jgi:cyclohexa-1,5-dienecarbonyl-CoA hydratase
MSTTHADLGKLAKVSAAFEYEGSVLRLTLDDSPGNVLDREMTESLRTAVRAAGQNPDLKLLVFTGAGKHFSFGASVEEHRPEQVADMLETFHGLFRDLVETDLPALAVVRGQCLGGGLELASFCDWLVAAEGAHLGQPEIKLGVFAPLGSILLPWRCGAQGADLLLTGRTVDALTALTMGLVDELLPETEPEPILDQFIRDRVLGLSASSLRLTRRAARLNVDRALREDLPRLESLYLEELMKTHDAVEGIEAFLEKRKPTWRNA